VGFFDSLLGRKSSPSAFRPVQPPAAADPAPDTPADVPPDPTLPFGNAVSGQAETHVQHTPQIQIDIPEALGLAREHLDRRDLPAALQLYEQIVHSGADLAAPLATISGDLGATGHIEAMIDFVAPLYDPERHGSATGLNLLQACLHLRNDAAAQQQLDVLRALGDPGLADRLDGFQTALTQLRSERAAEALQAPPVKSAHVSLVTISKPVWTYGLEHGENCLPTKHGRERRIAFLPIALTGVGVEKNSPAPPDHPLAPVARGLPLALAEFCWFSPDYQPIAVVGVDPQQQIFLPPRAFGGEQARDLLTKERNELIGHAVAGTIQAGPDGTIAAAELTIWDAKKGRLVTTLRAEGPDALQVVWQKLLSPVKHGPAPIEYAPPADPAAHASALNHALYFFLADKKVLPVERVAPHEIHLTALATYAETHATLVPRLTFLGAIRQCTTLGLGVPPDVTAVFERIQGE
jgi:hypothetical protein